MAARIAAVFAPFRTSPRVDQARQLTVMCVGHSADFDLNSMQFGLLFKKFKDELTGYVLSRCLGVDGDSPLRIKHLGFEFRTLSETAIDPDAAARFVKAFPGQSMQVQALLTYYRQKAPMDFELLLTHPWEPPGF